MSLFTRVIAAVLVVLLLATAIPTPPAQAQWAVIDVANLIENILQTIRQIQEIRRMVDQLQTMYQNLESFDFLSWRDIQGWMLYLNALSEQGQALSYALHGVFTQYRELFPGPVALTTPSYETMFENWSQRTLDTLAATLDSASAQATDYLTTQGQLAGIQGFANKADGNLEALQANNMFQAHIAQEVAKLNQLLAADMNAQNVYFGYRLNLDANQDATHRWVLSNAAQRFPTYGSGGGSNGIPGSWPYPCPGCNRPGN